MDSESLPPLSLLSFFRLCSTVAEDSLEGNYGTAAQVVGIFLFVFIFNFIIKWLLVKLKVCFEKENKIWALSFVEALRLPLSYFVWFVALICAANTFFLNLFDFHLNNIHLLLSVASVIAFGWFLLRWNRHIVQNMMKMSQKSQISLTPSKLDLMSKLATISIIFLTLFLLMDVTGRNMQTLIAFGGIGGLAIAFASQQVVANFFGGLMVYITQPFTIGEWVCLPEKKIEGHIEEIGWYLTRIRSFDKRPIYVPNSIFTQTVVITPSRMTHERFFHVIGLRYQDFKVIRTVVEKIKIMLLDYPGLDPQFPAEAIFKNFGKSTLEIEISAYISLAAKSRSSAIKQELLFKIGEIVEQAGGEIATPNIVELRGFSGNLIPNQS